MLVIAALAGTGFGLAEIARGEKSEVAGGSSIDAPADQHAASSTNVSAAADQELAAAAEDVARSVVWIDGGGASGSGVIYDAGGRIITAASVVGETETLSVQLADGTRIEGRVLAASQANGLAVVAVDGERLPAAGLALGAPLRVGQAVVAVGSKLGTDATAVPGALMALSAGSGSLAGLLSTDIEPGPGQVGGALADARGRVIGVLLGRREQGGASGLAVPIGAALQTAERMLSGAAGPRVGPIPDFPLPGLDGLPQSPEELDRLFEELERSFSEPFRVPETPGG